MLHSKRVAWRTRTTPWWVIYAKLWDFITKHDAESQAIKISKETKARAAVFGADGGSTRLSCIFNLAGIHAQPLSSMSTRRTKTALTIQTKQGQHLGGFLWILIKYLLLFLLLCNITGVDTLCSGNQNRSDLSVGLKIAKSSAGQTTVNL